MKKIGAVLLAAFMVFSMAACGDKAVSSTESGTIGESTGSLDKTEIGAWTKEDWEQATDEEKTQAAKAALSEVIQYLMPGFDETSEEVKASDEYKGRMDQVIESFKIGINEYFVQYPDGTVGDMIQQTKDIFEDQADFETEVVLN